MKFYIPSALLFFLVCLGVNAQEYIYFESFNNNADIGQMPEGYATYNEDGNPITDNFVNAGLSFGGGWEVRAWQDLEDFGGVASSCSDFASPGTADDWMITPNISIDGTGALLVWQGMAVNGGGYEVYVSTEGNNLSDFSSLSPVETIDNESDFAAGGTFTDHSLDLSAYDGETIWIAFRNNNSSSDSRLIFINDVGVLAPPSAVDAGVTSRPTVEYGWLAIDQSAPLDGLWAGTAENFGLTEITNVQVALNVDTLDVDNNPVRVYSALSETVATLAPGESIDVTIDGTFTPNELRLYKFSHEIIFDEDDNDDFEENQTSVGVYTLISENFTSRSATYLNPGADDPIDPDIDDFVLFYTQEFLDITGSVGQVIDIVQAASMDSIYAQFFEPEGDIYATLYEFSNDNVGDLIATTETRSLSGITGGVLEGFAFDCPVVLEPGQYFIAYEDPAEGTANYTFTNYYSTPNRQFIRGNGGAWMPFNNAPILYANFSIGASSSPLTSAAIDATPSSLAFTFSATADGTACDYNWDFGDGNTGVGQMVNHLFEAEGTYTVCVTISNNDAEEIEQCTDVDATCSMELAEGELSPSSIEVDVSNNSGDVSFEWSDGQTANPAIDLEPGIEYSVVVTDEAGCTAAGAYTTTMCSIVITIDPISGSSALVNTSNTNGSLEFFWQNTSTGEDFSTDQAFVSGLSEGAWNVTVVDESGCSESATVSLVSGIDNPGVLVNIELAPNPSAGILTISLNTELSDDLTIRLFDLQGKELMTKNYASDNAFSTDLNLSTLADGMYLIHFSTGDNLFARRIVLSK